MIFILIICALGLIICLYELNLKLNTKAQALEKRRHEDSVTQSTHKYKSLTLYYGTEFRIKDYHSDRIIEAVYLGFNTETNQNEYQQVIGTTQVNCSDEWLYDHLIECTGDIYDVPKLLIQKSNYNNFLWTCPMCGSHFVKEISTTSKATSIYFAGAASKNIGKNYHCTNCDYKW